MTDKDIRDITDRLIRIEVTLNAISNRLPAFEKEVEEEFKELKKDFSDKYVTKEQFSPIQKVIYSTIGTILIGIVTSFLTLIIRK